MPTPSVHLRDNPTVYDVIVVGSGAGGGMATHELANAGLKVAVVEAGAYFDPADPETMTQLKNPWDSPRRGRGTTRAFGEYDQCWGDWSVDGEPYTHAEGTEFHWWRARMLGGRTNHWGRISLRFGPKDFKHKDVDGLGDNWPIGYDEVKPYYDRLDRMVGVFGTNEGLPNDPDGFFLPPPKPRLHELFYIKGARKSGVPAIPGRMSMLTKKLNDDRGVCFYCGQCSRSCFAYADFSAGSCLVFPAMRGGGQVDLYVNAHVRQVDTDDEGLATGVTYVNTQDRQEYALRGKTVVLAASACSSARILLNSASAQHPGGLGNSSGLVGRYLHDSTGASRMGFIPALMDRDITYNEDGVGGLHVYSPWWGDNSKLDFPRGYHIEQWGGMGQPSYGFAWDPTALNEHLGLPTGGYGERLRTDVKRFYGATVGLAGRGEGIAREDNYCELDPNVVDQYGIPVLRFNYEWSDYERNQARHMQETFKEVITNMGGIPLGDDPTAADSYGLEAPGRIIHEVGTTRMGDDPRRSVTNKYNQLHDAPNVLVVDAGPFVSQADKNCTWTIMALSMRASEHLVGELKRQNLG